MPLVLVNRVVELFTVDLDGGTFYTSRLHVLVKDSNCTKQCSAHVDVHAVRVALVLSEV